MHPKKDMKRPSVVALQGRGRKCVRRLRRGALGLLSEFGEAVLMPHSSTSSRGSVSSDWAEGARAANPGMKSAMCG